MLALILQLLSFLLVLLLSILLGMFNLLIPVLLAAVLQGGIAAGLSRTVGQARWWWFIQFFFPVVLVLMLGLHLPPTLFLGAFLILLLLYWSTYRTQVPFYPSRLTVWQEVERLLPEASFRFVDIGSGLGGLPLYLKKQRGDGDYRGVEIAPLPWSISRLRAFLAKSAVRFERSDYQKLNFADYDVIFAYLSPAAMPALWQKARAEMMPGALLLSYEFTIPDQPADIVITAEGDKASLYGWRM
ncbi:class I SAM-dependent methyltransferase [uncultured Oxalicibacterium sp.]|uniref:class I SAM-dependent methyltransferase n=1 Tax=uncultured Oxalicibacterium sp. TaxID=1168540 RepID=UPI0025ECE272|nr:class I SAM-dependent methyltransferase [uncultured Oxalicibacterium sp.]